MVSVLSSVIAALLTWFAIYRAALPRVRDAVTYEVILGKEHGDASLPPVFAHRGAGHDAPENTLAAIRQAKDNNAFGIEFDLSFTNDSVAVLFHDETLDRTTDGVGALAAISFEDVRRLDAAIKHPLANRYRGERVPTLEEGVEECLRLGLRIIVDVKQADGRAIAILDELFRRRPELYRRALVASSYPQFIYALRKHNRDIVTALTWRPGLFTFEDIENRRPRYKSIFKHCVSMAADWILERALHYGLLPQLTGVSALLISTNALSVDYVRAWHDRGIHVIAWTSNDPAEKEFLRKVLRVPVITDSLLEA
ncbi:glycerophosphodiester phosphodiesterase 1-like [Amblyomma americanum]